MPRPQSLAAQRQRIIDRMVANSPWLTDEERRVLGVHRDEVVAAVGKSPEGKRAKKAAEALDEQPLSGPPKGR